MIKKKRKGGRKSCRLQGFACMAAWRECRSKELHHPLICQDIVICTSQFPLEMQKKKKNTHTRSSTPFNSYNVLLPWEGWYLVESLLSGKTCQVWSTQRLITTGTLCPYCRTPKWRPTYFSVWCLRCTSRTSLHWVSFFFFTAKNSFLYFFIPFFLCFFFSSWTSTLVIPSTCKLGHSRWF